MACIGKVKDVSLKFWVCVVCYLAGGNMTWLRRDRRFQYTELPAGSKIGDFQLLDLEGT